MNLFIVESPGKIKKIQSILGSGFAVSASIGHIRDLPIHEMGIEFNSWKIKYQLTDKGKGVYKKLKDLAEKSERIYLATDLDREGEAIAWHLAVMLKIPPEKIFRVKFSEINEAAVKKAIAAPGKLNMDLVRAQEARRAVDRLVGYIVSPAVSRAIGQKLSAGRVQSVILRLIVDRYNDHQNFVSRDYFGAVLRFDGFSADWNTKPYHKPGDDYNFDRALAVEAAAVSLVNIQSIEAKNTTQKPPAPFTTSTMQQAAIKKLGFDTEGAMKAAQELYEAGVITYHRTDSVDLSEEAIASIRNFATAKGLPLPTKPNAFKSRAKNAQEAHEAIRPTDISVDQAVGLSESASRLYQLIHKRTLLCQLKPAELKKTTVTMLSEDQRFEFVAKGSVIIDKGWLVFDKPDEEEEDSGILPPLQDGQELNVIEGLIKDQKTRPPALFDEASLIGEMERLGIGRPSTYAPTIKNIKTRSYIQVEKKKLVPTDVGQTLRKALAGFAFMEYGFTSEIEELMDAISNSEASYQDTVRRVFQSVLADLHQHFGYAGKGEDFFLPSEARDYKPSEIQLEYANKIADSLGLDISSVNLESGREVSAFLEKNAKAYKLNFKPTDKQVEYAQGIAVKARIELPDEVKLSAVKLSAWIDKNKQAGINASMASKAPSERQIALAEKLAADSGNPLLEGYATNMLVCSQFIDQVMGGKPKPKKRKQPAKKS